MTTHKHKLGGAESDTLSCCAVGLLHGSCVRYWHRPQGEWDTENLAGMELRSPSSVAIWCSHFKLAHMPSVGGAEGGAGSLDSAAKIPPGCKNDSVQFNGLIEKFWHVSWKLVGLLIIALFHLEKVWLTDCYYNMTSNVIGATVCHLMAPPIVASTQCSVEPSLLF